MSSKPFVISLVTSKSGVSCHQTIIHSKVELKGVFVLAKVIGSFIQSLNHSLRSLPSISAQISWLVVLHSIYGNGEPLDAGVVVKKVDKVQILVDVALVILCGVKAKPRKLFQGPPIFTSTTQWIRTITLLLGDDVCNGFGWKNLQLKEDFTLLNIKNSKKDILSSNYVLQFIFKKF